MMALYGLGIEDLTFDFPLLQAVLTLSFLYQALERRLNNSVGSHIFSQEQKKHLPSISLL